MFPNKNFSGEAPRITDQTNLALQASHNGERIVKRPRLRVEMLYGEVLQSWCGRTFVQHA